MFSAFLNPNKGLIQSVIGALLFMPLFVSAADSSHKPQAVPVAAITVHLDNIPVYTDYSARAQAAQQVDIYARVSGILQKKFFTEGQKVKAGQLLYKIDDRKYRALVLKAKAQVNVAKANLNQAKREYNRVKGLYKNKAVSAQEVDTALSNLELAKADLEGQKAALNETQIDLDYTEVRAEISGIVGIKQQDIGSLVGSNSENSLLTNITQLDVINVVFAIPDADYIQQQKEIQAGKLKALPKNRWTAQIINSKDDEITSGKIDYVDSNINTTTGSIQARAVFDNKSKQLMPGSFVRLRMTDSVRQNVSIVPKKAVLQMGGQSFVYKVTDGIADLAPVHLGDEKGSNWLVDSGLSNGDIVVTNNLIKLRPKTPVSILPNKPNTAGKTDKKHAE
ncbi:efflux RND transporter periplasmic adaptor subunit [Thiomicrorhabdus sp. Milos-T2]|uniref:efflux RND transporter periplasmic adaptor subunit n=1 Tax=Thiomicrorhabdus sp. Milos-T2 TaxID=90814 RepID=UPI00068C2557|nr:efflux RND transporter periplasmic adaptor subunit [Thiomicrorhabdus sp. Milos-T2]